jgi:DNA-binding NtrC family response regulator
LQNHELQRVGSPAVRKVDVRVIAATNRDLRAMTKEGKFREDLYYRIGTVEIKLPRFADRKEDLPLLQRHFVEKYANQYQKKIHGITRRAQAVMAAYSWPGNVRELDNVIGLAAMMTETSVIDVKDLPKNLWQSPKPPAQEQGQDLVTFEELQRRHLNRVLEHVGGDKTRAAEILGISRTTLYNLLSKIKSEASQDSVSSDCPISR